MDVKQHKQKVPRCRVHDAGGLTITMTRQTDDVCVCGLMGDLFGWGDRGAGGYGGFWEGVAFGAGVRGCGFDRGLYDAGVAEGALSPSAELFTRRGISV